MANKAKFPPLPWTAGSEGVDECYGVCMDIQMSDGDSIVVYPPVVYTSGLKSHAPISAGGHAIIRLIVQAPSMYDLLARMLAYHDEEFSVDRPVMMPAWEDEARAILRAIDGCAE